MKGARNDYHCRACGSSILILFETEIDGSPAMFFTTDEDRTALIINVANTVIRNQLQDFDVAPFLDVPITPLTLNAVANAMRRHLHEKRSQFKLLKTDREGTN